MAASERGRSYAVTTLVLCVAISTWIPTYGQGGFNPFFNPLAVALSKIQHAQTSEIPALIAPLSPAFVVGVTGMLNETERMRVLGALNGSQILNMTNKMTPEQRAELLGYLPADGVVSLSRSLTPEELNVLMTSLPTESIVTLTQTLNKTQNYDVISRLSSAGILGLISSLNETQASEVLARLPVEGILDITAGMSSAELGQLIVSLPSEAVLELVASLPPEGVTGLISMLPPETVQNLTLSYSSNQLSLLLESLPSAAILSITDALDSEDLLTVLMTVNPDSLVNLTSTMPDVVLNVTYSLNLTQMVQLVAHLKPESVVAVAQVLPGNYLGLVLDITPVDVLVNLTTSLTTPQLLTLLHVTPVDSQGKLIAKLPEDALSLLLDKMPPQAVSGLVTSLPTADLVPTVEKLMLNPTQLSTLLISLNTIDILNLVGKLPANTTRQLLASLPGEAVANLTMSLPPTVVGLLFKILQPEDISALLKKIPEEDIPALTKALPDEALAMILTSLPDDQIKALVMAFSQEELNEMVPRIPVDLLLNLTKVLPSNFITDLPLGVVLNVVFQIPSEKLLQLFNEFFPQGPMSLLGLIPESMLSEIVGSITPQQIQALLNVIPKDKLNDMIESLLPGLLNMLTQGGSLDLGQVLSEALSALVGMLQSMDADQRNGLMSQVQSALPALVETLTNVTSSPGGSVLGDLMPGLVQSVVSSVPMSSLLSLAMSLLPELPRMLATSLGEMGSAMAHGDSDSLVDCVQDVQFYLRDLANGTDWAVRMFDASGKPGRGMLLGNTHMHGSYDMCVHLEHSVQYYQNSSSVTSRSTRHIKGAYCGAEFKIPPNLMPPVPGKDILPEMKVEFYLCLPNSCKTKHLSALVSQVTLPANVTIPRVFCQEADDISKDTSAIAAICVLSVLTCLIVLGTLVDVFRKLKSGEDSESNFNLTPPTSAVNGGFELQEKGGGPVDGGEKQTSFIVSNGRAGDYVAEEEEDEEDGEVEGRSGIIQALLAFSLPANAERILGVRDVSKSVTCLHGIRVLSMMWLIVGNSVVYMAVYFENALEAADALQTILGQVIIHSTLAVDSFFLISGCLTTIKFLKTTNSEGGVKAKSLISYYLHRYIRLTPAYALTIMVLTCLLPYLADGPKWTLDTRDYYHSCKQYWWTNLLYINNFYNSLQDQCVPWGWYLATDIQFHWIVAPFIIIPFAVGFKVFAFLLIACLTVLQAVLTFIIDSDINGDYIRNRDQYWWQVFEKPYTRVAPFVLGLGVGYILTRVKGRLNIHKAAVLIGWLVAMALILASVLVKYDDNHVMLTDSFHWSATARVLHETLHRICFSLGLSWLVLMCATGHGGVVNSILSWKVFIPFSHLTFCMYLLHPALIQADMWATRVAPFFTVSYLLQRASGYIMFSAIFAFVLSVAVETPINALERIVLGQSKRRSSSVILTTLTE